VSEYKMHSYILGKPTNSHCFLTEALERKAGQYLLLCHDVTKLMHLTGLARLGGERKSDSSRKWEPKGQETLESPFLQTEHQASAF
jgi:hypothetical protein